MNTDVGQARSKAERKNHDFAVCVTLNDLCFSQTGLAGNEGQVWPMLATITNWDLYGSRKLINFRQAGVDESRYFV